VTSNTTTLTVTLYGFGPNATSAQLAVQQQLQFLQNTLSNVTVSNIVVVKNYFQVFHI